MNIRQHILLAAIYAELPQLKCKRLCQRACGPVFWSEVENDAISEHVHGKFLKGDASLTCPYLDKPTGDCTIYAVRPLLCRLWGLVPKMACPWGCRPERWLTDVEAYGLLHAVEAIP